MGKSNLQWTNPAIRLPREWTERLDQLDDTLFGRRGYKQYIACVAFELLGRLTAEEIRNRALELHRMALTDEAALIRAFDPTGAREPDPPRPSPKTRRRS